MSHGENQESEERVKIAVVSDTHSNFPIVERALAIIAELRIDWILHCGDLEDADTVRLFPSNTHFVLGNCDTDVDRIRQAIDEIGAQFHDGYGVVEYEGCRIAFLHGHDRYRLRDLENAEAFHFIFHGHTHQRKDEAIGMTRVVNPGALYRATQKTFAVLHLPEMRIESVVVA